MVADILETHTLREYLDNDDSRDSTLGSSLTSYDFVGNAIKKRTSPSIESTAVL